MKNSGFICGFSHANGETVLYGSRTVRTFLSFALAGVGAALALLGAGFLLGRKRR